MLKSPPDRLRRFSSPAPTRRQRLPSISALLIALTPRIRGRRAQCQAMRAAGFADVTSADGDVRDLARLVGQRVKGGTSLLYLAGADRAGDLAGSLSGQRLYRPHRRDLSRHRGCGSSVRGGGCSVGRLDGVLHFSRRSAEAFLRAARNAGAVDAVLGKPTHFCISANVAEALVAAGAADIRIAAEPTEAALMALVPARCGPPVVLLPPSASVLCRGGWRCQVSAVPGIGRLAPGVCLPGCLPFRVLWRTNERT